MFEFDQRGTAIRELPMRLEGIHHVTAITGDAPGNVDFYVRVLGLRLVKKTVNQDDPTVYHLFYADEKGSAGSDITFFEYPGARRGRAGAGMVHRVVFRVSSEAALDFWEERLRAEDVSVSRSEGRLTFSDPEGMGLELAVVETSDEPLTAEHPEIPTEHRIQGFDSVRAYTQDPGASREFLEGALEFQGAAGRRLRGAGREPRRNLRLRPDRRARHRGRRHGASRGVGLHAGGARGLATAGDRRGRLADARHRPLLLQVDLLPRAERRPVRDRDDRPRVHGRRAARDLGERLSLPPNFEHLREQVEPVLTPITNPRESWAAH